MLASAYGLNYQLPQDSMVSRPIRGGLGQPQQPGLPEIPGSGFSMEGLDATGDLFVREGVTEEYYKKVAALKSFANEVSSRYGYDVTRPNYRDPESIKYHRAYLESLADIQRQQNELKSLQRQETMSLQSPNVVMRRDEEGRDFAANIGENDIVKRLAVTAQNIKNEEDAEIFENELKPRLLEQLREEAASSQDPRERAELEASIQNIENIRPSVGLSPYEAGRMDLEERSLAERERHNKALEAISRQRADQPSSGGRPSQGELDAQERVVSMSRIASDPQNLRAYGMERVESASGTFFRSVGEEDPDKWVKIDPKRPDAWMMGLNALINKHQGFGNVSFDKVSRVLGDFSEQFAQTFIQDVDAKSDISQAFVDQLDVISGLAEKDKSVAEGLKSVMESGLRVPKDVANAIDTTIGDKPITNVTVSTSWGGKNKIKFFVPNKTGNSNITKTLDLSKENDLNILRKIISHNADRIDRSLLENLMPSSKGGTNVAESSTEQELLDLYDDM